MTNEGVGPMTKVGLRIMAMGKQEFARSSYTTWKTTPIPNLGGYSERDLVFADEKDLTFDQRVKRERLMGLCKDRKYTAANRLRSGWKEFRTRQREKQRM
jgi:hypothetical protein